MSHMLSSASRKWNNIPGFYWSLSNYSAALQEEINTWRNNPWAACPRSGDAVWKLTLTLWGSRSQLSAWLPSCSHRLPVVCFLPFFPTVCQSPFLTSHLKLDPNFETWSTWVPFGSSRSSSESLPARQSLWDGSQRLQLFADLSSIQLSRIASLVEPSGAGSRADPSSDAPRPCATYRPRHRGCARPLAPEAGTPTPTPMHHQELLPSLKNSQEQGQLRKRPFFLLSLFFSSLSRKRTALLCSVACHKIKVLLEVTRESTLPLLLFSTVVRCSPNHRGIYSIFGLVPEEKAELFEKPVRTRRKRRSFQKICFGFCPTGTVHVGICLCRTKESNWATGQQKIAQQFLFGLRKSL